MLWFLPHTAYVPVVELCVRVRITHPPLAPLLPLTNNSLLSKWSVVPRTSHARTATIILLPVQAWALGSLGYHFDSELPSGSDSWLSWHHFDSALLPVPLLIWSCLSGIFHPHHWSEAFCAQLQWWHFQNRCTSTSKYQQSCTFQALIALICWCDTVLFCRYKTVRSRIGRYLNKARASGSGTDDFEVHPEYSGLTWLFKFIKTRATTTNIINPKAHSSTSGPSSEVAEATGMPLFLFCLWARSFIVSYNYVGSFNVRKLISCMFLA